MNLKCLTVLLVFGLLFVGPVQAPTDVFVSDPSQLRAALSAVQPGQTIWLNEGTYRGHFLVAQSGTALARVTIRSLPGELATLDGNFSTFLALPASTTDVILTVTETTDFRPALVLSIDSEDMQVAAVLSPTQVQVNRHWNGTVATSHGVGAIVQTTFNPVLKVTGAYITIQGLQVMNSNPNRLAPTADGVTFSQKRGHGIWIEGAWCQVYNNYVHDNGDGIDSFGSGVGSDIVGNIVWNNGISGAPNDSGGRDHGQPFYLDNKHGDPPKTLRDNICINNYSAGKVYGVVGYAENVLIEGHVAVNNGSHAPLGHLYERALMMFVGTEAQPVDLVTIQDSFTYQPPQTYKGTFTLGWAPNTVNGSAVVRRTHILGDQITFLARNFSNLVFEDNTVLCRHSDQIAQNETMIQPLWLASMTPTLSFDRNTYYDQTKLYSGVRYPVRYGPGNVAKTFPQWKSETGQDANSTYSSTPTGVRVFVRVNPVDPARAHVIVVNWDQVATVGVDLSGVLQPGDRYVIRNAQDPLGVAVEAGIFNVGCPVVLPMDHAKVSRAIGGTASVALGREFQVFVVERQR